MTGGEDPLPLAELRRAVYRTLSALFLYPDDERVGTLVAAAPEVRRITEPLGDPVPLDGWDRLLERVEGLTDEDVQRMREEHTLLFVSGARATSLPPYGSAYAGGDGRLTGYIAASVQAAYAEAGLVVDAGGEPPDHVAVELDFLSYLCGREGEAEDAEAESVWLERQRVFLVHHLLPWLPRLADDLEAAVPDGLYRHVAGAASEFARRDLGLIEALAGMRA